MIKKEDYFYYGSLFGIPIYFQPENNEIVPKNKFWEFIIDSLIPFCDKYFRIKIYKKTITRQELKEKGIIK